MSRFVVLSCVVLSSVIGSGCGLLDKYPSGSRGLGDTCEESIDCEGSLLCSSSGVCVSSSGGGGSCGTGGDSCTNGCCSTYICVNWSYEPKSCAATCTRSSQCNSGCCVSLSGGGGACNTKGPNSTCL